MSAPLSEYEVVSTTKGPNGEEVSILTTNQTHTAVENLKPESRYVGLLRNRVPLHFRWFSTWSGTRLPIFNL